MRDPANILHRLCVYRIDAVCSCRMRGRCEWVCSCVWHVHITCIYMCACEYRVWCICGICVCVYRVHIFSPPLVLAWASSVFGSLRARRRSGVCFIQVLLPFPLPGAPAVALVPSAHLWGPPPHLLPSLASGGSGARSPGKAEEVTLMDRIAACCTVYVWKLSQNCSYLKWEDNPSLLIPHRQNQFLSKSCCCFLIYLFILVEG